MRRSTVQDTGVLASDETFQLESLRLKANRSSGIIASSSDVVLLIVSGPGRVSTADRVHELSASNHAYINAGIGFEITAGTEEMIYLMATCPGGNLETRQTHDFQGRTGGVTILRTDRYDHFPDSGLVRGGMFFLDEEKFATYHSHDAAAEVFVFLKGECDAKVEGVKERFSPGDVLYVPAEEKHELANGGEGRLEVWLTVTPNVTPSHTFYAEQSDGTWLRVTHRLDGRKSRPPGL
ncbi:MAG: cupin domain-containing protein [Chloroflexi bacterium]|nr:cupin domain-containing protein [Chloroflexota bacterium]